MGLSRNASRKSEDFLGSISERVLIFESGKERGEKGSVGTRNAHVTISMAQPSRKKSLTESLPIGMGGGRGLHARGLQL
jgi:hypothetical protein